MKNPRKYIYPVIVLAVAVFLYYNNLQESYKTNFRGLPITIEFRKGDVKSGTDVFGNQWSKVLKHHYGYFDGIMGADGKELDVYINPDNEFINSSKIFRIEQLNVKTGEFDEYKIMLGFDTWHEAGNAYLNNMPRHWGTERWGTEQFVDGIRVRKPNFFGSIEEITLEDIK